MCSGENVRSWKTCESCLTESRGNEGRGSSWIWDFDLLAWSLDCRHLAGGRAHTRNRTPSYPVTRGAVSNPEHSLKAKDWQWKLQQQCTWIRKSKKITDMRCVPRTKTKKQHKLLLTWLWGRFQLQEDAGEESELSPSASLRCRVIRKLDERTVAHFTSKFLTPAAVGFFFTAPSTLSVCLNTNPSLPLLKKHMHWTLRWRISEWKETQRHKVSSRVSRIWREAAEC